MTAASVPRFDSLQRTRTRTRTLTAALGCLGAVSLGSSAGAACIDYSNYLRVLGSLQSSAADVRAVVASGPFLYVASEVPGLQIVTVEDPGNPQVVSSLSVAGFRGRLDVSAGIACLTVGLMGVQLVDVTDAFDPQPLAILNTPASANDVVIEGTHAYVADAGFFQGHTSGLLILDVTDPGAPWIVGSLATYEGAYSVAASRQRAYLADGDGGLRIIDVADPGNPSLLGTVAVPGRAVDVDVSGSLAYVAAGDSGLHVLDVSDPETAHVIGSVVVPDGGAWRIAVDGGRAFVTADWESDPRSHLRVVDVSDPNHPELAGTVDPGDCSDVVVGKHVFVAGGGSGLHVIEVGNGESPKVVPLDTPGSAGAVSLQNGLAFVADGTAGLQVIDISSPEAPSIVGSLDPSELGIARGLAIAGNDLYLADGGAGFHVIDVTTPETPQLVGSADVFDGPLHVVVSDGYAYVAAADFYPHGGKPLGPHLLVFDVSDRTSPQLVADRQFVQEWGPFYCAVAVSGTWAYFAASSMGLFVVDVSVPEVPQTVAHVDIADARGVVISGPYVYVADRGDYSTPSKLRVLDVSYPPAIHVVGSVATPDRAVDVAVAGEYAYVTESSSLQVIDVFDPQHPRTVGQADLPEPGADDVVLGVALSSSHIFIADAGAGLQILPRQCGHATGVGAMVSPPLHALATFPNPASRRVTIRFDVPARGPGRAAVYDIGGRLIRTLTAGPFDAGVQEVDWDARDDAGRLVMSGIYVLHVVAPGAEWRGRAAIVR